MKETLYEKMSKVPIQERTWTKAMQIATHYGIEVHELHALIMEVLTDEISLSHTTLAGGKTSRLTSAFMRIKELLK